MSRESLVSERVQKLYPDAKIESVEKLSGGMSAEIFLILFDRPPYKLIARFPGKFVREIFADAAMQEFRTLEMVHSFGINCPRPISLGEAPDGHFLLLEYLEGTATASPKNPSDFVRQVANELANIHRAPRLDSQTDYLLTTKSSFVFKKEKANSDLREQEVVDALVRAGDQGEGERVLRHGDFWPGNILWKDGKISGIIDWENVLLGPAIADLAISRLDIFWILGKDAMQEFTHRYLEARPIDTHNLPYWDLRAAMRPMDNLPEWANPYPSLGRPDITPEHLREVLLEFIDGALSAIA